MWSLVSTLSARALSNRSNSFSLIAFRDWMYLDNLIKDSLTLLFNKALGSSLTPASFNTSISLIISTAVSMISNVMVEEWHKMEH